MTVEQVIIETVNVLQNINIPVSLIEQIGEPVNGAIGNLRLVLNAFEEDRHQHEQPQDPPVDVSIEEISPAENSES